jgi:hypothetical protein
LLVEGFRVGALLEAAEDLLHAGIDPFPAELGHAAHHAA